MPSITDDKMELYVEIKNEKPLELLDLTKSLVALGSQFNKYANEHGYPEINRDTKLYVEKIESGSVLVTLYELAKPVLPMINDVNTIVGFAGYVKEVFTFFKTGKGEKPQLKEADYKDFNAILNPIAKDNAAQYNITAKEGGTVYVSINTNSLEANAMQNQFRSEIEDGKKTELLSEGYEKVLFYWDTTKSKMNVEKGNKGIIDSISKKPLNVTFDNEGIKAQMLHHQDENPLMMAYEVDVNIQTIQGKPAVYKITKVHQSFLRDDGQE